MTRAVVLGAVVGLVGIANADDGRGARDHARSSTTLYLGSLWSPGPTVPIRIGVEGALRVHRSGLALEARVGGGGAASVNGLGGELAAHGGASLGVGFALGDRVVLAPMVAYDVFFESERYGASVTVHYVTFELPVAIVLRRGVVIEPFIQAGFGRYQGATDPVLVIGPRIGIVL